MIIGSIKEHNPKETRISLTPDVVKTLTTKGHHIILEKDYGVNLGYANTAYLNSGAKIADTSKEICLTSEIITQIQPPNIHQSDIPHCQLIIADFSNTPLILQKTQKLRLELVPRTSVAQSIDILSSQSIVRGYMIAAYALFHANRIAPQMITAAATIKPMQALIIGASTTGLEAAAILKKIGCRTTLIDIKEQAKELSASVGADFILSSNKNNLIKQMQNKNIIINTAPSKIELLSTDDILHLQPFTILIDTTCNSLNISSPPPFIHFYRNTRFECLAPLTASYLWANNILNLLNLILPEPNTLDLSADYIKPMLTN